MNGNSDSQAQSDDQPAQIICVKNGLQGATQGLQFSTLTAQQTGSTTPISGGIKNILLF